MVQLSSLPVPLRYTLQKNIALVYPLPIFCCVIRRKFRENGQRIYCGWNVHHILPKTHGGTDAVENLICTNIITNENAADKITYWIDDSQYQVKKIFGTHTYQIVQLQ